MRTNLFLTCVTVLLASVTSNVQSQTTIDFENLVVSSSFENDVAGAMAGPFVIDGFMGTSSQDVTFTTDSITGFVDTSSFGLGVNSGGGDPDTESFNVGETWGMRADVDLLFVSIDLGGLQPEETFRIQSNAWVNLANITPDPSASVLFDSVTGTFSFVGDAVQDDKYTLEHLTGGTSLFFESDIPVVFGNLTSTFGPNDDVEIQSLAFFAVPEPGSGVAILLLGLLSGVFRSRRS